MGPVTPAIQSGWAPKMEKMKAAMNEDRSTSETPYWFVVSMRSNEKAIPGKTLHPGGEYTGYGDQREGVPSRPPFSAMLVSTMHWDKTHLAKNMRTMAGITR